VGTRVKHATELKNAIHKLKGYDIMKVFKKFIIVGLILSFMLVSGCANPNSVSSPELKSSTTPSSKTQFSFKGQLPKTLAIFPFENNSVTEREHFGPLGKGIAAMLTTGLNISGAKLKLVERENIQALMEEVKMNQGKFVDESTAIKLGKILGAESIGFGSFIVMGSQVRLDMRIIKVETGELVMADFMMGDSNNVMGLVQGLAQKVADSFNMAFHAAPAVSENNMNSALLFSKGLDALDRKDKAEADRLFTKSVQMDPSLQNQVTKALNENKESPASRLSGTGPQIIILNPLLSEGARGSQAVERKRSIRIEGLVKDSAEIRFVKINGQDAVIDKDGNFFHDAVLSTGDNPFRIVAMNNDGDIATRDIHIESQEDKLPPKIVLISPRSARGYKRLIPLSDEKETLVEGLITDDSSLLYAKVNNENITINKDGRFFKQIVLEKGQGITIEAADEFGNKASEKYQFARGIDEKSRTAMPDNSLPEGAKPALWCLSVGVSQYAVSSANLEYADKDALSLADFLQTQEGKLFSEVNIKTLVNEQVTRDSIIRSITTHLNKAAPDDVIFIFIAGHGIKHSQTGSYYFMPYDSDLNTVMSKGLRMSDFDEAVKMLSQNVNKVIIAIDTCHSGAMKVGSRSGGVGENLAEALREASGLFILSASKGGEASLENEDFKLHEADTGHGAFTYALLKGMSGEANYDQDDYISLNELFQYVAKQVPRLTEGMQHPYFRSEGTDMPFIFLDKLQENGL